VSNARGQWGSQAEFILSCLGYAMGLGNVWKFPYTCFSNGGGAYLIPYIVVLALVGIPTFFLELIMGQWSGKGAIQVWCLCPIFEGVGLGTLLISGMINVFYTMLLTYCLYYFAMCFQKQLPWDTCSHDYNTPLCFNVRESKDCKDIGGLLYNRVCYNQTQFSDYDQEMYACNYNETFNETICSNYTYNEKWEELKNLTSKLVSSSEEFFFLGVLERTGNIDQTNGIKWELVLCLGSMWLLCFFTLIKGIESSGKVVYFTTTFPYVVLTILLVRGVLLEGSVVGIKYLVTPQWRRLGEAKVWGDAAGQIFFALSVGCGGLLTYSSYNKFHGNIYRDTLVVAIANACTDWYAGFVVFSALGYMATMQNVEVKDVAADGAGLAFIVYPQVLATLPVPQLWSVLFFMMLVMLGLDSLNAGMEAIITSTIDKWPSLRRLKALVTFIWCVFFFLISLPMCCRSGYYWLDLVSYYSSGWTLVVMGIMESVVFSWLYGAKKVMAHVHEMVGFKLFPHWWFIWTFACPLILLAVLIFNLVSFESLTWNGVVPPAWAAPGLGWTMTISPLALIVLVAIYRIIQAYRKPNEKKLSCWQIFRNLFKPNHKWKSALETAAERKQAKRDKYRRRLEEDSYLGGNGVVNPAMIPDTMGNGIILDKPIRNPDNYASNNHTTIEYGVGNGASNYDDSTSNDNANYANSVRNDRTDYDNYGNNDHANYDNYTGNDHANYDDDVNAEDVTSAPPKYYDL